MNFERDAVGEQVKAKAQFHSWREAWGRGERVACGAPPRGADVVWADLIVPGWEEDQCSRWLVSWALFREYGVKWGKGEKCATLEEAAQAALARR